MSQDVTAPGRALYAQFVSLGKMTEKRAAEIIAVVGQPTSKTSMHEGQTLMQWEQAGCSIALLFDASDRFISVVHRYGAYPPFAEAHKLSLEISSMMLEFKEILEAISVQLDIRTTLEKYAAYVCNADGSVSMQEAFLVELFFDRGGGGNCISDEVLRAYIKLVHSTFGVLKTEANLVEAPVLSWLSDQTSAIWKTLTDHAATLANPSLGDAAAGLVFRYRDLVLRMVKMLASAEGPPNEMKLACVAQIGWDFAVSDLLDSIEGVGKGLFQTVVREIRAKDGRDEVEMW